MRVAGEVADGVLLNWCTPERVRAARTAIQEGAAAAGRDPADVTVAVYVRASLGASEEACMRALRTAAGEYASYPAYARQFALMGLEDEARASGRGARRGAARRRARAPGPLRGACSATRSPRASASTPTARPAPTSRSSTRSRPLTIPIGSVARTLIAAMPV